MTEAVFVQKNSPLWQNLELVLKSPAGSFREIDARTSLYRTVSGHLSYARTHYPGSSLCEYLERLTAEAHAAIYAHTVKRDSGRFFSQTLPQSIRDGTKFLIASAALFLVAMVAAYLVCLIHPQYVAAFLPESYSVADAGDLRDEASLEEGLWSAPIMSNEIMVNNIRVSVLAFALGLTCGIGTVYVLLMNGAMLGALASVYAVYGRSVFFWSLILPHGVWELTAIFLAGAAGLQVGYSLIRPGPYRRVDALLTAARSALGIMGLVALMLVVAGIVEGFYTPLPIPAWTKLIFSAITALPLVALFLWVYLRRTPENRSAAS